MKRIKIQIIVSGLLWTLLTQGVAVNCAQARQEESLSKGRTVYVPVYSQIYFGDRMRLLNLTVTLSIRNTDPATPITLLAVDYHDAGGKLLKKYLETPVLVGPLATSTYLVGERDVSGGPTPSFIVKWKAEKGVNEPRIESVMIGVISGQGISFTTEGRPIRDTGN